MGNYSIEFASKQDVEKINEIVNYYIKTSGANWNWSPQSLGDAHKWFDKHDYEIHPIFVAKTNDGQVVGYSSLSAFRNKSGYWPVAENSIYIKEGYQGLNIGNKLMEELINHANSSKLEVITAWIDSENSFSIDFHIKWGFAVTGEMKDIGDKWDERRSVTIMQLSVK